MASGPLSARVDADRETVVSDTELQRWRALACHIAVLLPAPAQTPPEPAANRRFRKTMRPARERVSTALRRRKASQKVGDEVDDGG